MTQISQEDMAASAVTTVVSRRVDSRRHDAFNEWTRAGLAEADRFDGFLGGGCSYSDTGSDLAHVVYRFDTQEHLDAWLGSGERREWLQRNFDAAEATSTRHLTGVEGWFGGLGRPAEAAAPAVPRWKQATIVWLGFFPVSLVLNYLLGPHLVEWPTLARTLLITTICTPFMTYVVLPFLTTWLSFWLAR